MIYVDTSALVKLVVLEKESEAVERRLADAELVSSSLLLVEARRGILRRVPDRLPAMDLALSRVDIIEMSAAVVDSASHLPDPMLRSFDAVHLATALLVREDLDVLVTFDDRFAAAAARHGLTVDAPGR